MQRAPRALRGGFRVFFGANATTFGMNAMTFGARAMAFGARAMTFGPNATTFWCERDVRFGPRPMSFGARPLAISPCSLVGDKNRVIVFPTLLIGAERQMDRFFCDCFEVAVVTSPIVAEGNGLVGGRDCYMGGRGSVCPYL